MDLSAFSSENFDSKDWINNAFKAQDVKDGKEAHAASLVMKLQLVIQEVNNSLEETSHQVLASLPRIVRDAESLQQEAALLQGQMKAVKSDIAKVEQDTLASMTTLMTLDDVKNRMQVTMEALREADNWTALCSDVEEVFESGDIHAIATKLEALHQSLSLLGHVSDWSSRVQHLDALRNRLEALASPSLVQTFNSSDVEEAKRFMKLFASIDRVGQFVKYYRNCQKARLLQEWRTIVESEPDESLEEWMDKFYDFVSNFWYDQLRWCDQLFVEDDQGGCEVLVQVIADGIFYLDPPLGFCIKAQLKQFDDPLPALLHLKQVTDRLANLVKQSLVERKDKVSSNVVVDLCRALYSPFTLAIACYGQYESSYLRSQLKVEKDPDEPDDVVRALINAAIKLPSLTKDAVGRCDTLSNGTALPKLLEGVQSMFNKLNREWQLILQEVHQETPEGAVEDWALFQRSLSFLHAAGELLLRVEEIESILMEHVRKWNRQLVFEDDEVLALATAEVFQSCLVVIFLEDSRRSEVKKLLLKLVNGEQKLVFPAIQNQASQLVTETKNQTLSTMFLPIAYQLNQLPNMEVWTDTSNATPELAQELPSFSFQPQEYITQVGEFLMTVPQYLEPWLGGRECGALEVALKHDGEATLRIPSSPGGGVTDELLSRLANKTCQCFVENILKLEQLTVYATRQLVADIEYLGNILEDLGGGLSEALHSVIELLKLTPEDYFTKSGGHTPRYVAAIRQMRGLTPPK